MSNFKSCPICGSFDLVIVRDSVDEMIGRSGDVLCKNCGCKAGIDKWNNRFKEENNHDRLTEENAKLRKMLKYAVKVANDPNATYTAIEVLNIEAQQLLSQLKDQNNDK